MKIHLSPTAAEGGGEFEAQVLDKVGTIERTVGDLKKNSAEVILADQSRWPKELKAAMEDLTKLKGVANDTQGNFDKMTKRMEQLQAIVKREARIAFGNPIERITRDEQLSARMNALIRIGLSDGERNYRKDAIGILERADLGSVAKALGEDSSPGSTLINQDLLTEVYHTLESFGIWNTFAVRALGTKTNILPVKTARAVALAIISEGTQISDDANKTGTTVTATVIDVACLINVYLRLIEDAEVDVVGDVLEDFAEAVAYRLDQRQHHGRGARRGGLPQHAARRGRGGSPARGEMVDAPSNPRSRARDQGCEQAQRLPDRARSPGGRQHRQHHGLPGHPGRGLPDGKHRRLARRGLW